MIANWLAKLLRQASEENAVSFRNRLVTKLTASELRHVREKIYPQKYISSGINSFILE